MPYVGQYWDIYGEPSVGEILMKNIMSLGNVSVIECERVIASSTIPHDDLGQ